ncbi:hypothetical protein KBC04_05275 [Candidatus Babeliales bacterium]|nr:hypothetical protein [Candidatus Babeliales bacterium]MBP9844157.1 hypothetical protein [Candidatus Babeliales bacterium]
MKLFKIIICLLYFSFNFAMDWKDTDPVGYKAHMEREKLKEKSLIPQTANDLDRKPSAKETKLNAKNSAKMSLQKLPGNIKNIIAEFVEKPFDRKYKLMWAAESGNLPELAVYLAYGADGDINTIDKHGDSLLDNTMREYRRNSFLTKSARNQKREQKQRAFHYLKNSGACITGNTVHTAIYSCNVQALKSLIAWKADLTMKKKKFYPWRRSEMLETPLDYVRNELHHGQSPKDRKILLKMHDILENAGAPSTVYFNRSTFDEPSPGQKIFFQNLSHKTRNLIGEFAGINNEVCKYNIYLQKSLEYTPLQGAVKDGYLNTVVTLLAIGADINKATQRCPHTPLELSTKYNSHDGSCVPSQETINNKFMLFHYLQRKGACTKGVSKIYTSPDLDRILALPGYEKLKFPGTTKHLKK